MIWAKNHVILRPAILRLPVRHHGIPGWPDASARSRSDAGRSHQHMSLTTTIEPHSRPDVAPPMPRNAAPMALIERWLRGHLNLVVLAITGAGFVARISLATTTYLNPDEILHYLLTDRPSLLLAYHASLSNAHPPLIYLLLYLCHLLGRSELVLRLPLILAGTAFCWFTFEWIQLVFGGAAGLFALIVVAFSPIQIALSAEIREYALLLCCMAAALYFLERAFQEKSLRTMWYFSFFLYMTILSHYSALFFVAACGIYALARFADSKPPRKVLAAWAGVELGALAIYVFLYVTHVAKLKNQVALWALPFGDTFLQSYQQSIFHFTAVNTWNIFLYMFAQRYVATAMLIAFLAGLVFLFFTDFTSTPGKRDFHHGPRHVSIQLLLPFFAVWAAAIAGIYPYVGSRHTAVLVPLILAAASFAFAAVCRNKLWAAVLAAGLLAGVSVCSGNPSEPGITKANQNRELMTGAISYMHQAIPAGDLILVDQESSLPLAFYYCEPQANLLNWSGAEFDELHCQTHPIVTLHFWHLRAEGLAESFEKMAQHYGLKPGNRVWVFQAGWKGYLLAQLPHELAQFRCVPPKTFGENITIVPLMVGPGLSPTAQVNCHN
jgi:Dolichyl-phosphate-mannose-protein mannosyltransferase